MGIILATIPAWFLVFYVSFPGTVPENVRTCEFKRNLSNLDRAPKMQDNVLLNSWASLLVSLPSISSETCAIYSAVIPVTDVFCDWLFLGYSCVSLDTAANARLFSMLPTSGKWSNSGEDWIICIFRTILEYNEIVVSPFYEEMAFNQ